MTTRSRTREVASGLRSGRKSGSGPGPTPAAAVLAMMRQAGNQATVSALQRARTSTSSTGGDEDEVPSESVAAGGVDHALKVGDSDDLETYDYPKRGRR